MFFKSSTEDIFLIVFGDRGRERERNFDAREKHQPVASCMHQDWGSHVPRWGSYLPRVGIEPVARYVPCPGLEPATFLLWDDAPSH